MHRKTISAPLSIPKLTLVIKPLSSVILGEDCFLREAQRTTAVESLP
jgi:hypothetical protein